MQPEFWPAEVHRELGAAGVRIVGYVPDAGHKRLIELCQADPAMRAVALTTEEEGIGLAAGAWLGGEKSVLLMQSSGVGNLINVLGMVKVCRFPLVMIVTMRGEQGEFNPWQVPMGEAVARVLDTMGVAVRQAGEARTVAAHVRAALRLAYEAQGAEAVLVAQRVIGIKSFQEQANQ
ncbi:MAG TPA: thiamine pyrophosphate-binding protein [Burkholderiales bacterium]|jgi:sulfopyruvate decarboxylase alpha subunit|nr:thiamine pyrophosphate-binding protein [Burkholderiales bacterium]